ncbi:MULTISPECIES: hypothetical protein [unclassified Mucilaginibacter]|nr:MULTISPECIES: hypothetical protein [unclassified Mucilaginibacter]MEB0262866.1 hypothetical protein [Mucilaginibacter sp. 10I4]MEB0277089.1 hypothetical protein [Mucilaginibacter sp. 10B2]MEB0301843.1 hypothetical protein [Mucilaginibacter sp. 5C4]WPX25190.1 hypothetical protein RHM67_07905 [Mucilaginibacter sp. 5C4]
MAFDAVSGTDLAKVKEFISPHNISFDPNDRRKPIVMLKAFFESCKP